MIKSLFGEDGPDWPPQKKTEDENEDAIKRQLEELNLAEESSRAEPESPAGTEREIEQAFSSIFETPKPPIELERETSPDSPPAGEQSAPHMVDNFELDSADLLELPENENPSPEPPVVVLTETPPADKPIPHTSTATEMTGIFRAADQPLTTAETLRQSGMAWSAAVGLFGSVVFMMILGWGFDLLTGASPWGLVGGILLGALIGFYQFFRVTSQIFKR
jgi:F0F1-type ATP synthase assembly protein I